MQFNPQKLLQKVSHLTLVGFSVLFNILKVYRSRTPEVFFFQDGVQDGRHFTNLVINCFIIQPNSTQW